MMSASVLTFDIGRDGDHVIVRCHGKLVAGANESLYTAVRPLIPDCKRITLDLSAITHMDSMGLGTVVRLYVSAKSSGCQVELVNFGEKIRKLLATTNLLSVLASIGHQGFIVT